MKYFERSHRTVDTKALNKIWQGNMVPKSSTFPSGIKALADYVHGKGLKLGIYSDAG